MLQRVKLDGIKLPRLYIAENKADAELAMTNGIPFIRWTRGQDELVRILLRPTLERMFPHIKWTKVLGPRRKFKTQVEMYECVNDLPTDMPEDLTEHVDDIDTTWVPTKPEDEVTIDLGIEVGGDEVITETADPTTNVRVFHTEESDDTVIRMLSIEDYVGDLNSCVDLDVLQRLRLMPAFLGDIMDCVKLNIGSGVYWSEGYNKKRALPVGRYDSARQRPNLVILDVSGSIPRGISATMLTLIDTMRTQLHADLIITSSKSRFYPMGSELPSAQELRDKFGYANESHDFFHILTQHIRGHHYGHVISFGDNDTPDYQWFRSNDRFSLEGTLVDHVHHYHTGDKWGYNENDRTGYAKWCHSLGRQPIESTDTTWCKVIRER